MKILRPKWLVALVAIFLLLIYYNIVVRTPLHQFLETRGKLVKIRNELEHAKGELQILSKRVGTSEASRVQTPPTMIHSPHEILSEFLARIGSVPGIQYNRVEPKEVVTENKMMKLPFALEGTGAFEDILNLLKTLKSLPLPTKLDQVTLSRGKSAEELVFSAQGALFFLLKPGSPSTREAWTTYSLADRNPFQVEGKKLAGTLEAKARALRYFGPILQGIAFGAKPYAIIDGQVVSAGAQVNGYNVIRITPDHVLLKKRGRVLTLKMEEKLP